MSKIDTTPTRNTSKWATARKRTFEESVQLADTTSVTETAAAAVAVAAVAEGAVEDEVAAEAVAVVVAEAGTSPCPPRPCQHLLVAFHNWQSRTATEKPAEATKKKKVPMKSKSSQRRSPGRATAIIPVVQDSVQKEENIEPRMSGVWML
jgi:hypothetical protein